MLYMFVVQKPCAGNMLPSSSKEDMRHWIVMTLLDSERTYVLTLSTLLQVIAALQFVTTLMSSVSFSLSFRLVNENF